MTNNAEKETTKTDYRNGKVSTTRVTKFEPNEVVTVTSGDCEVETKFLLTGPNELLISFCVVDKNVDCVRRFIRH